MDCSTPGFPVFTISRNLLKLMFIKSVMPSNHLILCRPLLLLPSIFSSIRVFTNESVFQNRWPKYYNFSFSISPFNEYSGLISFRMDWSDLLAVQGTLKSLLQHHTSKASILLHSAPGESGAWNRWNLLWDEDGRHLAPLQIWSAGLEPRASVSFQFSDPSSPHSGRDWGLRTMQTLVESPALLLTACGTTWASGRSFHLPVKLLLS